MHANCVPPLWSSWRLNKTQQLSKNRVDSTNERTQISGCQVLATFPEGKAAKFQPNMLIIIPCNSNIAAQWFSKPSLHDPNHFWFLICPSGYLFCMVIHSTIAGGVSLRPGPVHPGTLNTGAQNSCKNKRCRKDVTLCFAFTSLPVLQSVGGRCGSVGSSSK